MNRAAQDTSPNRTSLHARRARLSWPELSRSEWLLIVIAAAAALATVGILATDGFRRASELSQAQQWEAHTLNVIASAERTRSEIRNMQRGERGYLLTADEQYLLPYRNGRRLAQSGLQQLRMLTRDNQEQARTLDRLAEHFHEVDSRLINTIAAQRSGRAADALLLVRGGRGEIGRIDSDIDEMISVEDQLLQQRRQVLRSADAAAWRNRIALSIVGLVALSAAVWLLFTTLSARRGIEFERERAELAEQLINSEAQLAEQVEELNALYASAPIGLAFFSRDYRYLRINQELARANGRSVANHIGRTVREIMPAIADALEQVVGQVFDTGATLRDLEFSAASPLEPDVARHWLMGFYPVRNDRGDVDAVGTWMLEITERKKAEEREALLAREVDHRAKNLLAIVQSVVQLTQATSPDEFKAGIVGRIQALARAHSLLADARWDGAQLGDLVREELAPYLGGSDARASVDGLPLFLKPAAAQAIAMVLHELATNAAKYGALSTAGGRLEVCWTRKSDSIEIRWSERDGPIVAAPTTSGFGSKIVRATIERQLHGSFVQDWRPEGLQCEIRISARETLAASEQQIPI